MIRQPARTADDLSDEELDAQLSLYQGSTPTAAPRQMTADDLTDEEVDSMLNAYEAARSTPRPTMVTGAAASPDVPRGTNVSRFIGEQLAKGIIGLTDIAHLFREHEPMDPMLNREERMAHLGMTSKAPSQFVPEMLQQESGIDINSQPEDTGFKRIAGHALRAIPSAILGGPAGLARNAALVGTMGATSGIAQEAGVNPLVADIGSAFVTPSLISTAKKIASGVGTALKDPAAVKAALLKGPPAVKGALLKGRAAVKQSLFTGPAERKVRASLRETMGDAGVEEALKNINEAPKYHATGYKPLTAEIAKDPTLAQLHRAQMGQMGTGIAEAQALQTDKLRAALAKQSKGAKGSVVQDYAAQQRQLLESNAQQALEDIGPHLQPQEAGRILQGEAGAELSARRATRREPTSPIYDAIDQMDNPLYPEKTHELLNTKYKVARGDLETDKKYVEKLLTSKFKNYMEGREGPVPTIAELSAAKKAINSRRKKYNRSGEEDRELFMRRVQKALGADLKPIPEQAKADALYRELSPPIDVIKNNPALRKVVHQREKEFTLGEASVPETLVHKGASSADTARILKGELWHRPEFQKGVKGHLNRLATESIVDIDGKVIPDKITKFQTEYGNYKTLHPELFDVKLKNTSNAQVMANKFIKQTKAIQDTLYQDEFGKYLAGKNPHMIMKKVFTGNVSENIRQMKAGLKDNPTAEEGFRRLAMKHMSKKIENAGHEGKGRTLSAPKIEKILENKESLKDILTRNQIKVLEEAHSILTGKADAASRGAGIGSPSVEKLMNTLGLSTKTQATPLKKIGEAVGKMGVVASTGTPYSITVPAHLVFDAIQSARKNTLVKIVNRMLVDTPYADYLLTQPLKDKSSFMDFVKQTGRLPSADFAKQTGRLTIPSVVEGLTHTHEEEKDAKQR
jgi:hypothetical protein